MVFSASVLPYLWYGVPNFINRYTTRGLLFSLASPQPSVSQIIIRVLLLILSITVYLYWGVVNYDHHGEVDYVVPWAMEGATTS